MPKRSSSNIGGLPVPKRERVTARSLLANLRAASPPTPLPLTAPLPDYRTGTAVSPVSVGYSSPTDQLSVAIFEDTSPFAAPECTQAALGLSGSSPPMGCGAPYPALQHYIQDAVLPVFPVQSLAGSPPIPLLGSRCPPLSSEKVDIKPTRADLITATRSYECSYVSSHASDLPSVDSTPEVVDLTESNPKRHLLLPKRRIDCRSLRRGRRRLQLMAQDALDYQILQESGRFPGGRKPVEFTPHDRYGNPVFIVAV